MKKLLICFLCLITVLTACSNTEEFRASGSEWTAGFGKCELIPEVNGKEKLYIAGYKVGSEITGILDYQFARAIWLDDGSGRGGIILAAVDCIGLSNTDINEITASMEDFKRESGCRAIHIFSTHTHAGIDTLGLWGPIALGGKSESFQKIVFEGVKKAAVEAYENRKTGQLYVGSAEVEGMQKDSRPPEIYDKTLTCIRFDPDDGTCGIRIVNFAAHAESLRSENTLVSADYPAYMGLEIEAKTGDDFMFIPGFLS